jgi:hypothetical protein|tara:strand:+ start:1481 stop:1894 length:414 start_codon:yes stop_codon:yes gene_type:complete
MAHFAKMTDDNITVLGVHVVADADTTDGEGDETEAQGVKFLSKLHNWTHWKKCSFNTHGGVHVLEGTPYRKNYPSKGSTYDADKDAFIPSKPYNSWTLNNNTCRWEPPTAMPEPQEGKKTHWWHEASQSWKQSDPEA